MSDKPLELIDRGRGLQLSTSRVTVQDLVPYFQDGCTSEEIQRWIPTLTRAEIAVVEAYYRQNQQLLDEADRRLRDRSSHRKNPDWVQKLAEDARAERNARRKNLAEFGAEDHA